MLADSCKINRKRLIETLKSDFTGKIYFKGGCQQHRFGTDTEYYSDKNLIFYGYLELKSLVTQELLI